MSVQSVSLSDSDVCPKIDSVPPRVARPLLSVMIPTFHCAGLLRETLESVLAQDWGPELMQIEVVDDCSVNDDPERVVREVAGDRVSFHRNETNTGCCTHNFNICIRRSRGELVHILHGDDWLLPGFYDEIRRLHEMNPDAALLAARSVVTNERGVWNFIMPEVPRLASTSRDVSAFHPHNALQCVGVVVRRGFYERHGGFRTDLIHCADYEMWNRAISREGGVVSPRVLSCYRVFDGNDTGRLKRTADNLRDWLRATRIFEREIPDYPREKARKGLFKTAKRQWQFFLENGDVEAARANGRFVAEMGGLRDRWRVAMKHWRR